MSDTRYLTFEVDETLEIALDNPPDDWLSRCFTTEWQAQIYHMEDEDEVYRHLLYNCVTNGVQDISLLDGWADVAVGAVRLRLAAWESHG